MCATRATTPTPTNDDWHVGVMNSTVSLLRRSIRLPMLLGRMTKLR
jgi:hypothetical protein